MYSTVNLGFAEFSMAIFKSVQDKIMRLFWLFSVGTHACNQMSVKFHLRCKIIVFWVKITSFRKSSELVRLSLWEVILFFSREWAISCKYCNLIGSKSGWNFSVLPTVNRIFTWWSSLLCFRGCESLSKKPINAMTIGELPIYNTNFYQLI